MSLAGKDGLGRLISPNLDPQALVRLCRDVLFVRCHSNIRCTDGPGDGGRDIHSLNKEGQRHLAQSKFHANPAFACSSNDLSELPMAMIKLGYTEGLFVTNARISPQGKREFLDNYPKLKLEFLDGDSLAEEVLANTMLKALWFDGANISRVNVSTVIPLLARRHEEDLPIRLEEVDCKAAIEFLSKRYPAHTFRLQSATTTTEPFKNYRAPEPLTVEEGIMGLLHISEVVVEGEIALSEVSKLPPDICKAFLLVLGDAYSGLTVKTGQPFVIPLRGEQGGARILMSVDGDSWVKTSAACGEESDWFFPGRDSGWSKQTDARMTQAEWIRLYNGSLDCAMAYEIECRSSQQSKGMSLAHREIVERGWSNSVFCLMQRWGEKWPHADIPEPDEKGEWPWNGQILCGWLHWTLLGGPIPLRGGASEMKFFPTPAEEEDRQRLDNIRTSLRQLTGIQLLEPSKARHMVATIGNDPFQETDRTTYLTCELAEHLDQVPSPIRLEVRKFKMTMAWRSDLSTELLTELAKAAAKETELHYKGEIKVEHLDGFLVMTAEIIHPKVSELPTVAILADFRTAIKNFLDCMEQNPKAAGLFTRATKDFWSKRFEVTLGVSWKESPKAYVWGEDQSGKLIPLNTKAFLEGKS